MPKKDIAKHKGASTITRAEIRRLFKLINDESIDNDASFEIGETCDVIYQDSSITNTWHNEPLFIQAMLDGWQERPDDYTSYWQGKVRAILDRTKAGESPESIIADLEQKAEQRQREYVEGCARKFIEDTANTEETREALRLALESGDHKRLYGIVNQVRDGVQLHASGEPVNTRSDEWRYWKLRQMERALRGELGAQAQRAARREFKQIARDAIAIAAFDRYHAEQMLPDFIIAIQQKGGAR
jgi:hypothetical protein